MRAGHLRQWLISATQDDLPDATNWQKVVDIVQEEFHDGALVKDSTWQTVVLITKGVSGDFSGIGMV